MAGAAAAPAAKAPTAATVTIVRLMCATYPSLDVLETLHRTRSSCMED